MTQTILIVLFAAGVVALLVLGYSITYFFRGRHMQSQTADNDSLKMGTTEKTPHENATD